ncbi:MAG: VOC family protein [Thermomicrobiales bacterium]
MNAAVTPVSVGQVTMYPILRYRDLPVAIDWLCRVFSFEPLEAIKNEDGTYAHVELRLGDWVIMPTTQRDEVNPDNPWDGPIAMQGVYVALDGIDAHYERAVAEGAEIVRPLADTDYGSREYTARDLEGNLWAFGTYRPMGA